MLALAVVAVLAGARSWATLAQFGKDCPHIARRLGFRGGKTPSGPRWHHLFRYEIDGDAFERLLHGWVAAGEPDDADFKLRHIDGKRLRGTADGDLPGIHLLAAYALHFAGTVAQLQVPSDTNEHKTALELLRIMPLEGTVVTGDAAFTQLDLSEAIVAGKGHYLWMVKDNQPALRETVAEAFSPPPSSQLDGSGKQDSAPSARPISGTAGKKSARSRSRIVSRDR